MKLKQPDCRAIIYNYNSREGSKVGQPLLPFAYEKLDLSHDVISISTNKTKMSASGQFSITLAPTRNWVAEITSGSWIAIFMDEKQIPDLDLAIWKKDSLKWIGRVDTVRANRSVDQNTGAYMTQYSVSGRDWCAMLEAFTYVDPIAADMPQIAGMLAINSSAGQAARFAVDSKASELYKNGLPSSSRVFKGIIDLYGKQFLKVSEDASADFTEQYTPSSIFNVPISISISMGKKLNPASLPSLTGLIDRRVGVLKSDGSYKDTKESVGTLDIRILLGINSLWQILQNSVTVGGINEVYADLSFSNGKPDMALYKRVKPFFLEEDNVGSQQNKAALKRTGEGDPADSIKSSFFYLPKTYVDLENIVSIDIGTNWSDVVNFIEILPDTSLWVFQDQVPPMYKLFNATYNTSSYAISGFKPMKINVNFFPPNTDGAPHIEGIRNWLPVLKDWYFNLHKTLNGTITFSGQSGHTAVGDNVLFSAKAIAEGGFVANSGIENISSSNDPHILAHIESVSHMISKTQDGGLSYMTTVQFVRGVITDSKGSGRKSSNGYGIDSSKPKDSRSNKNTYGV